MTFTDRRFLVPLLTLCLTAIATPPQARQLEESVAVVATEVPVHVTLDGAPVRGLTADNFRIYDNGKLQRITGFEVRDLSVTLPGAPQRAAAPVGAPQAARRHLLFLFDLNFSQARALARAREAVLETLREGLHPTDLVAVATWSNRGAQLILNFTSDHKQVEAAVVTLKDDGSRRLADPLALTIVAPDAMTPELGSLSSGGDTAEEQLRIMQVTANRAERKSRQQLVTRMTRDLTALATLLDSVEGRKDVVYFSEGFDNSLIFATEDRAQIQQMNQAGASGQTWAIDQGERFGDVSQLSALDDMLEAFRKAGCVIHTIDLGTVGGGTDVEGGRRSTTTGGNHALSMMARETGGSDTRDTNELDGAMEEVVRTTSVTYVLVFQPPGIERDGKFHRLKVKLEGAPKGAEVSHRPGYYAPRPFGERTADERQLEIAGRLLAAREGGSIPTEVLAVPFWQDGPRALVPVVLEIDGPKLLAGNLDDGLAAQIFVYALDGAGRIRDLFTQTVGIDLAQAREKLLERGLKFYGTLRLAPGSYTLRVLVLNGVSGQSHLRIVELQVPAPEADRASLLPPFFPDPYGKWLLVPPRPGGDGEAPPFPFMTGEAPFLPDARPSLASGDELELVLIGRDLGDEPLEAVGSLLDASGETVRRIRFPGLESMPTGLPGYRAFVTRFPPGELEPGRYELSLSVSETSTAVASFEIVR